MAAPYNPPVKNEDLVIYVPLPSAGDPGSWQANPTIAAGDFKVSKDGGAFANLTTLPDVDPNSGVSVKISLSSTEMNADNVVVTGIDQTAPKEWLDLFITILTTA